MTDMKYYITNTIDQTVMVTPDNRAIYFDTEEEAQYFFDNHLMPEDKEIATITLCIMFYDGGYVNWKDYREEFEKEE